ncbi:MAG: deoxyribonuclease IV [Verrucomicrobiota bacterium]|nr:deoxyribonuclease IV [Verrucomicrobiota bacterium]
MIFGAHMSTGGGVWKALERGMSIGCDVVQLFVKSNVRWLGRAFTPAELSQYSKQLAATPFSAVFGHTGYLINLGAPAGPNRDNSVKSLVQEIELATDLKLPFLVMHPGAHLGGGKENCIRQIVTGLDMAFDATKGSPVRIALENTAGQGSCLGDRLAHLGEIFKRVKQPERLGVCIDTAHLFAAGYDIRAKAGWDSAIEELDQHVGLKQILAFHLNDSKTELGSRVDRHAGIGQGKIGKEAFRHIVNDPRFKTHPGCLETPKSEDMHEDVENLAILRSLVEEAPSKKPGKAKKG